MSLRKIHIVLLIIAAFSLIELIFNGKILFTFHSRTMTWDAPVFAADNDDGIICVADSKWRRLTILNPDRTVKAMITPNYFSSVAPVSISGIAVNDKHVYISDKILSKYGTHILSERILKYDLDGNYVKTVLTDTTHHRDDQGGNILNIKILQDTLYAVQLINDTLFVRKIYDSTDTVIITHSPEENAVHYGEYQPEINTFTVFMQNGKTYSCKNGEHQMVAVRDSTARITSLIHSNDGTKYMLDTYNGNVIRQNPDSSENVICNTTSLWICSNAPSGTVSKIFICDDSEESVMSISIPDGTISKCTEVTLSSRHLFNWYWTLACLIGFVLISLYFLISLVRTKIIKHFSHSDAGNAEENEDLTTWELYGKPAVFLLIAFVATGLIFSISYYNSMVNNAVSKATNIAASISALSDDTVGDAFDRLKSAENYGNADYTFVNDFCHSFCSGENTDGFDLGYKLIKFDRNTGEMLVIFDFTGENAIGTKIPKKKMIHKGTFSFINTVFNGENVTCEYQTAKGVDVFYAMSPMFNSSHNVIGAIFVIIDINSVSQNAIEVILSLLLKIITLLSVILLSLTELRLLRDFFKVRLKRVAEFGKDITTCEGHRTLRILANIPFFLFIPFISPYAKELAIESGQYGNPAVMAALPISMSGLSMALGCTFMSIFTKKNPKRYMHIAGASRLILALLMLANIQFRNYYLLVAIFVVFGMTSAFYTASFKSIRLLDLKPDKRYARLVFTNMEAPIAVSIGTALGALLYDTLGLSSVIMMLALFTIAAIVLTELFIGSDVNISGKKEKETKNWNQIIRYLLRPEVIGCLLFLSLPYSFLNPYSSYLLPMFNESNGYPVLLAGFLILLTKMLSMMISPEITTKMAGMKLSHSFIISLAIITAAMFAFAYQPTMFMLTIMLFITGIFAPVFATQIERFQIASAKSEKIIPSDVNGLFSMTNSAGEFAGPICIAALISVGYGFTGLISGIACLICIAGIFLTFHETKIIH